jgi:hypothetical protein
MIRQPPPLDAATFYRLRDNRTDLFLRQPPDPVGLALTIGRTWVDTTDGQLAFFWLASLISRMGQRYNHLQICIPAGAEHVPCRIPGAAAATFIEAVIGHLLSADPFGAYELVERPKEYSFVVSVGDAAAGTEGVVVRPLGWSAAVAEASHLSPTPVLDQHVNPVGAALAAALGAAEVYRHFNQERLTGRDSQLPLWVSAWRSAVTQDQGEAARWLEEERPLPGQIEIGRWMIVGAGALGANALAILGAITGLLRGRVDVIDHDRVDVTSLNRLVAALLMHAGSYKAVLAASCLVGPAVESVPHVTTYERLHASVSAGGLRVEDHDLVLTCVDQMRTRALAQSDWPHHIINSGSRGYTWRVSDHPTSNPDAACVGCLAGKSQRRYRDLGAPLACAAGLPGPAAVAEPPMDSYSFVSFLCSAFTAARALRHALGHASASAASLMTEASALNLLGLQHVIEPPSALCLCRCSHSAVRGYRAVKYAGGLL